MSLQKLKLPNHILADLYRSTLIQPEANYQQEKEMIPIPQVQGIKFLGGNLKKIGIIVKNGEPGFLDDADLEWLEKMLKACSMTLGDVAVVNLGHQNISIQTIKESLKSKIVLLLGTTPSDLQMPLNFPQFKPQEHDGCIFLYAPSPKQLNQEGQEGKLLKSKLWVSLQKLFDL